MKYYLYEHVDNSNKTFYIGKGTFEEKGFYGGYQRAYYKNNIIVREYESLAEAQRITNIKKYFNL